MRDPQPHDAESLPLEDIDGRGGARGAMRLAVVLWLLVGVTVIGLYIGLTVAPRGSVEATAPDATGPPVVLDIGEETVLVLVRAGGTEAGLEVAAGAPHVTVILGEDEFAVV